MTAAVASPPPVRLTHLTHDAVNTAVLPLIPPDITRLLDIGCGTGTLGARLKESRPGLTVVGVTISPVEADEAAARLDGVHVCDLNRDNIAALGTFDAIVCSHVLGYFPYPEAVLRDLHRNLGPGGVLIAAIPNVLHWRQRWELLRGRFTYVDYGVLHRYYVRFFDQHSAYSLFEEAGYELVARAADGYCPLPGLRRLAPALAARLDRAVVRLRPGLFATQFLAVAQRKDPHHHRGHHAGGAIGTVGAAVDSIERLPLSRAAGEGAGGWGLCSAWGRGLRQCGP